MHKVKERSLLLILTSTITVAIVLIAFYWWEKDHKWKDTRKRHTNFHLCLIKMLINQEELPCLIGESCDGTPTLSWRFPRYVHSFPTPGELDSLSKPWLDPSYMEFRGMAPDTLCFTGSTSTSIMAIGGVGSFFEKAPIPLSRIPDDALLIVEVNQNKVHWMEPIDLDLEVLRANASDVVPGSYSTDGFLVGFADGSSRRLRNDIPLSIICDFASISRRSSISREDAFGKYTLAVLGPHRKEEKSKEVWGRTRLFSEQ